FSLVFINPLTFLLSLIRHYIGQPQALIITIAAAILYFGLQSEQTIDKSAGYLKTPILNPVSWLSLWKPSESSSGRSNNTPVNSQIPENTPKHYYEESKPNNEEINRLLARINLLEKHLADLKEESKKQLEWQKEVQNEQKSKPQIKNSDFSKTETQLSKLQSEIADLNTRLESVSSISDTMTSQSKVISSLSEKVKTYQEELNSVSNIAESVNYRVSVIENRDDDLLIGKLLDHELEGKISRVVNEYMPKFVAARIDETGHPVVDERLWSYLESRLATVARIYEIEDFARREQQIALKGVRELEKNVVMKQEVGSMLEKLVRDQIGDLAPRSSDNIISEDLVVGIIRNEISRYALDLVDKPDFALDSSGAVIETRLTSPSFSISVSPLKKEDEVKPKYSFFSWWKTNESKEISEGLRSVPGNPPRIALFPDKNMGQCWSMEGQQGTLGIRLSRSIYPTHFAIDHLSKSAAFSPPIDGLSSAPRQVEFWGVFHIERFRKLDLDDPINRVIPELPPNKDDKSNEESNEYFPSVAAVLLKSENTEFRVYDEERPQEFWVEEKLVSRMKKAGRKVRVV
ncbi:hypothetical protein HK096_008649, partial [Nowakowskiella sp. JEL0078]